MFIWSPHGGGAGLIACYAILGSIAGVLALINASITDKDEHPVRQGIMFVIAVEVVIALVGGLLSFAINENSGAVPSSELSSRFGLQSDHDYPLVLGARITGSSGSATATGGFFSSAAAVNVQPSSAVSVSFTSEGRSYILEIPSSKITFVQSSAPASVRLKLTGSVYVGLDSSSYSGLWWTYKWSGCSFRFTNLSPGCHRTILEQPLHVSQSVIDHGLAPIVSTYLDSAVINLSPDAYQQLLGS